MNSGYHVHGSHLGKFDFVYVLFKLLYYFYATSIFSMLGKLPWERNSSNTSDNAYPEGEIFPICRYALAGLFAIIGKRKWIRHCCNFLVSTVPSVCVQRTRKIVEKVNWKSSLCFFFSGYRIYEVQKHSSSPLLRNGKFDVFEI